MREKLLTTPMPSDRTVVGYTWSFVHGHRLSCRLGTTYSVLDVAAEFGEKARKVSSDDKLTTCSWRQARHPGPHLWRVYEQHCEGPHGTGPAAPQEHLQCS